MCGILGTTNVHTTGSFKQALDVIAHRGPDSEGIYTHDSVVFGHRRLSIIDLADTANQPMLSANAAAVLVYNGEIYNFKDLRNQLIEQGTAFRTQSDSEVILEGYLREGVAFFERLRGMWAFAIYDSAKQQIVLSRDQFGIKPLFYSLQNNHLYFSSSVRALTKLGIAAVPDVQSYQTYFALGYFMAPNSCYGDVKVLEPNTTLIYTLTSGTVDVKPISKFVAKPTMEKNESEVLSDLKQTLLQSVEAHYVSDVPVGILFSGGTDSTLLAALSKEAGKNPTAYYLQVSGSSDTEYAEKIAKVLGINLVVEELTEKDLRDQYDSLWSEQDTPFADISIIPTSLIYKKIAGKSKVILSGEGGDEWFSGYGSHAALARHSNFRQRNSLMSVLDSLYGDSLYSLTYKNPVLSRVRKTLLAHVSDDVIASYLVGNAVIDYPFYRKAIRDVLYTVYEQRKKEVNCPSLFYDRNVYLANDLLHKNDSASMISSIEARVPLVDVDVYRHILQIPGKWCRNIDGTEKYLLKKILAEYLPHELVYRPKSGFSFSFNRYHIPQFTADVSEALTFHQKEAETFGLLPYRALLCPSNANILIKKYPRFAFALVSNWKFLFK